MLSCVWLFVNPWTVAHQTPLFMEFFKQEHWKGLPFPPPGDLPDPGIKLVSPALAGSFFTTEPPGKPRELFVVVVQSLSQVQLFMTSWTAAWQASLSFTISQNLLKFMSIESVMPNNSSSIVRFSSCLQSFPASGFCLMNQLFTSGGQSIGASASVLLMNIQGWFSLELTGLISWLSKGSQESSAAPEFESINSLACSLLCGPILTSIHDYWESHSFDYMDLCWQSDVSAL